MNTISRVSQGILSNHITSLHFTASLLNRPGIDAYGLTETNHDTNTIVYASLPGLPSEILVETFKHLDPVYSTCLGLTCKVFYAIHWELYGAVGLKACSEPTTEYAEGQRLWQMLKGWAASMGLAYDWSGLNLLRTPERIRERDKKDEASRGSFLGRDLDRCRLFFIRGGFEYEPTSYF